MLNVAEAVMRVFHARGDYQHKQRNRMKFLIKSIGWDALRAAFDDALAEVRAEGGRPLPFDPEPPPIEAAPDWARPRRAVDRRDRRAGRTPRRCSGPGIMPARAPPRSRRRRVRALAAQRTCGRRSSPATSRTVTVPLGDLSGAQFRVIADLARAYGDGTVRVTAVQNLVFRWVPARRRAGALSPLRPPASACRTPTRSPTSRAARAPSRASSR